MYECERTVFVMLKVSPLTRHGVLINVWRQEPPGLPGKQLCHSSFLTASGLLSNRPWSLLNLCAAFTHQAMGGQCGDLQSRCAGRNKLASATDISSRRSRQCGTAHRRPHPVINRRARARACSQLLPGRASFAQVDWDYSMGTGAACLPALPQSWRRQSAHQSNRARAGSCGRFRGLRSCEKYSSGSGP